MADVTVTINGHNYVVACKDGEEKHLHFLADYVSKKVQSLVVSFGQVGEARLLLMAALFCADELSEAFSQLGDLKAEVADLKNRVARDVGVNTSYSFLIDGLRDTAFFSHPYFEVLDIVPAVEDGYEAYDRTQESPATGPRGD